MGTATVVPLVEHDVKILVSPPEGRSVEFETRLEGGLWLYTGIQRPVISRNEWIGPQKPIIGLEAAGGDKREKVQELLL